MVRGPSFKCGRRRCRWENCSTDWSVVFHDERPGSAGPHRPWGKSQFKQLIFRFFFKRADEIIVNSYDFKKEMDKKYKIKCKCILNPFDFKLIKKQSLKKITNYKFQKKHLKLINVARLTDQKDHITLLKAVEFVKSKRAVELIILGKGKYKPILQNYISRNKLSTNIKVQEFPSNQGAPHKKKMHWIPHLL